MSQLNRRRKGSKWGHLSRWQHHQHPRGLAPWPPASPRLHTKHVFACGWMCDVWLRSCVLCVEWRGAGRNEQIKRSKSSDWTWLRILKQTMMFTARAAEPLLSRLFPSIYSTNDPITLYTLFSFSITCRGTTEEVQSQKNALHLNCFYWKSKKMFFFLSFFKLFGKYSSLSPQKANYWSHLGD